MKIMKQFNLFLQKQLNKQQNQAVTETDGAFLVIAGAGSGKTRIITARIANLILNKQAQPTSIIALTFTNKAAGEMKERVKSFIGIEHHPPFVGTFHSYCLSLLRNNSALLPFSSFSIIDSDDQTNLIKKIIKKNNLEKFATPSQINYQISNLKNSSYQENPSQEIHPILREIYHAYESEKAASYCFDFDDLIIEVLKLFKNNKEFKQHFQESIQHVLVDEYQDTSEVQHQLLKEMCLTTKKKFSMKSLCAVGDEDQSIYSWRGATVANMLKFQHDFKPVKIIKIEQNYRSVKPILDAANSIIKNNKLRNPKELWSTRKASNRILLLSCRSGNQEAETIATYLKHLPKDKKRSDTAILYRTHFQSRLIEEALIYHGIPYKIIGGIRFYERKEIKDILAYLRLIINPFDKISLLRVINCPTRGLGQAFETLLLDEWGKNPFLDFKKLLNHLCDNKEINLQTKKKLSLKTFLNIYEKINSQDQPSKIIQHILEKTDYLNFIRATHDSKDAETRLDNIQELVQSIINFEQEHQQDDTKIIMQIRNDLKHSNNSSDKPPTLETFLYEVSLLQEKTNSNNQEDLVQMMTLHAAKGLEFDTIIIAGLEEGLLPSSRSLNLPEDLEEERRLFYVGITRAKERLILLHASYRNTYGQIVDQAQSRFASEISEKLLRVINIEELDSIQRRQAINNWLGNRPPSLLKTAKSFSHSKQPKKLIRTSVALWKKNERVQHKKFGVGIITKVEKTAENKYYITAIFKVGKKKILSSFLNKK